MAQNDFTEDKATLFGAGMVTVGVFGKTALITKGVGVVAATKAGVLAGGFICPPAAICIGLACVGAGLINHFLQAELLYHGGFGGFCEMSVVTLVILVILRRGHAQHLQLGNI